MVTVKEEDRGKLVEAMRLMFRLPYDDFGREEWIGCLEKSGVSKDTIEIFEEEIDELEEKYGQWNPNSGSKTITRVFKKLPDNYDFDDWVSCPECGNEDVEKLNYNYHEAIVACPECGEVSGYTA